jgi:hypothetical protein
MTTAPAPKTNTSTALAPHTDPAFLARMNGTTREPAAIARMLDEAARHLHLVSPATSVGAIPEGFTVVTSVVKVDAERETYPIQGSSDRGLSKVALDRIAQTAGVSADQSKSGRLDDGHDPRYVHYRWSGYYTTLDGSTQEIFDDKVIDLRDGAPEVEGLWSKHRAAIAEWERGGKNGVPPKSPEGTIREKRKHILSLCITEARLRALRTLGLRISYSRQELARPFVVAKLAFTGHSDDPALRREFALQTARSYLGAAERLYGRAPASTVRQLPSGHPAPPVGSLVDHDDDGVIDASFEPAPAPPPPAAPADAPTPAGAGAGGPPSSGWQCDDCGFDNPPTREACGQCDMPRDGAPPDDAQSAEPAQTGQRSGLVIPGGRTKGTPIEDADDRDLTYWAGRIEGDLAEGKTREAFVERDTELARAMRAELARRNS